MPILDLLASITGEEPSASPNPVSRTSVVLPKRRAEDELRRVGVKVARADSMPRPNGDSSKPSPRPADRPIGSSNDGPPSRPRPTLDKRPPSHEKPSAASSKAGGIGRTPANGSKPVPSRPLANRPSPTDSGPPKKRSYAEIMARAKANSEQRESLGKIQHKTVERSMTMKERKEAKAEETKKGRTAVRSVAPGRSGATGMPLRDVAKAPGAPRDNFPSRPSNSKKTAPIQEKKVKKAALATTGYTGTARPRPGASTAAKPGATSRPGSDARSRDRPRYGGPLSTSRSRYDEDDELDDFIVDDEEEEPTGYGNGQRYRYGSDEEESDMEAGISDIEGEEQQADRYARREDLEQQALELRLKREKEERKRKFLETTKSKAGR
ncbi:hypothetical protein C8A00DRAFT_33288 [Chaetomidium leptoderma]|uniref:SPT2 chromatin protein n=1 Tax=Chaetomidium leptoderma TaxID=669021 RepID=A0AAN6VMF1_9PEZI|nr:hypothetical protein C8A00DRAFT_33288 [Chaetomidium leptoderma]